MGPCTSSSGRTKRKPMSVWTQDDVNPNVFWVDVRCNRCGREGRLGRFRVGDEVLTEKEGIKTQKKWVCCPGPPLWWEKIKRWWKDA